MNCNLLKEIHSPPSLSLPLFSLLPPSPPSSSSLSPFLLPLSPSLFSLSLLPSLYPSHQLYRKVVQQMIQVLIRKLTTLSQYEEALVKVNATATDRLTVLKAKPQYIQRDMLSVCNDPFTVAQQLTHIELVCY